jgi:hypothetical protein
MLKQRVYGWKRRVRRRRSRKPDWPKAEARASEASKNLKYTSAERLKAAKGDVEVAKKLLSDAQDEMNNASQDLAQAREAAQFASKEAGRQSALQRRQLKALEELEAAQRKFNELGNQRPPTSDPARPEWDRREAEVAKQREELNKVREESKRLLPEEETKLRGGTPPKTGTTARSTALNNARANTNAHMGRKAADPVIDVVTGKPLAATEEGLDHIFPVDKIFEEEGFNLLTYDERAAILEMAENYMSLRRSLNSSKGTKTFSEWFKTDEGREVPVPVRQQLLKLEQDAQIAVRKAITTKLLERARIVAQ